MNYNILTITIIICVDKYFINPYANLRNLKISIPTGHGHGKSITRKHNYFFCSRYKISITCVCIVVNI